MGKCWFGGWLALFAAHPALLPDFISHFDAHIKTWLEENNKLVHAELYKSLIEPVGQESLNCLHLSVLSHFIEWKTLKRDIYLAQVWLMWIIMSPHGKSMSPRGSTVEGRLYLEADTVDPSSVCVLWV